MISPAPETNPSRWTYAVRALAITRTHVTSLADRLPAAAPDLPEYPDHPRILAAFNHATGPLAEAVTAVEDASPIQAARLHLVLCEPPAEAWAAETVREAFGIQVLWRTRDGWGGDDPDTALGTQQE
ncbi:MULTISPECIES: hypothetical protein [Streptomyces]|uniref:hypothetical protein n=1 Tax=Streptomyces TaxID=1883 RepID=UPI00341F16DA